MSDKNQDLAIKRRLADMHVLVVDDSAFDRELITKTLNKIGIYSVHIAENGIIARSKLETNLVLKKSFDLIFLDSQMPAQDGASLLKWMRGEFKLRNQPVIMTTGTSNMQDVNEFIKYGVREFVIKPVTLEILQTKIFEALNLGEKNVG